MTRKERLQLMNDIIKEIPQETVELFIDYLNLFYGDLLDVAESLDGIEEAKDSIVLYNHMATGIASCSIDLSLKIKRSLTRLDPDKRKDI